MKSYVQGLVAMIEGGRHQRPAKSALAAPKPAAPPVYPALGHSANRKASETGEIGPEEIIPLNDEEHF